MKFRDFLFFYLSLTMISFSSGLTMLAIPWYFAQHNQSSFFNVFYAAVTLSALFSGVLFGVIIDRYDRKKGLMIFCTLAGASMVVSGFTPMYDYLLVFLFFLLFSMYVYQYPAIYAICHQCVKPRYYIVHLSLIEFVGQSTAVISAGLGVFLLEGVDESFILPVLDLPLYIRTEAWSMQQLILTSGTVLLTGVVCLFFVRYIFTIKTAMTAFEMLEDGLKFLNRNARLFWIMTFGYFIFISLLVERFSLLPVYVKNHLQLGGETLSESEIYYAGGSNVGSLLILILAILAAVGLFNAGKLKTNQLVLVMALFLFLIAVGFMASAFEKSYTVFMIVSLVFGLLSALSRIIRLCFIFYKIPNAYQGRVNSIMNVMTTIFRLGFILPFSLPFFTKANNIIFSYIILGCFTLFGAVALGLIYGKITRAEEMETVPTDHESA